MSNVVIDRQADTVRISNGKVVPLRIETSGVDVYAQPLTSYDRGLVASAMIDFWRRWSMETPPTESP